MAKNKLRYGFVKKMKYDFVHGLEIFKNTDFDLQSLICKNQKIGFFSLKNIYC